MKKVLFLVGFLSGATQVIAEPIKGQVDLGWLTTSGNSETTTINAQLGLTKETKNWKHEGKVSAVGNSSEDEAGVDDTTAEKYTVDLKSDRKLDDRSYLYAIANYTDDRFSGYDFQSSAGLGYGYKVIAEDDMTLQFEVGPGYSFNRLSRSDTSSPALDRNIEQFVYRIGEKFDWKFSETSELGQYVTYEGGDDLNTLKYGVFVLSKLAASLSLKIGVDVSQRGGDAQDAAELADPMLDDTDTTTYANISYSF